ncbi:MAG: diadenosine tetraphosphate hydrolase [Candidatus Magasanikbacteria bacterium]|jgi:diadenosine tetraphosphate (Ap4A) HIT family hydrolase|nr:diadenosine tetraphosphate hydrolase [Candidatus Magasanikbacteria bacterium]
MQKKSEITDINGTKKDIACLSCAIVNRNVTPPGALPVSDFFDAHQDYEVPIPGFIILASKRHIQSVDEFTKEEQQDFIQFLSRLRKAMRESLGIEKVELIQDEDTRHHFHMWLFPRYDWMEEKFGRKIESIRPAMKYAQENMKTEENLATIKESVQKLKTFLEQ